MKRALLCLSVGCRHNKLMHRPAVRTECGVERQQFERSVVMELLARTSPRCARHRTNPSTVAGGDQTRLPVPLPGSLWIDHLLFRLFAAFNACFALVQFRGTVLTTEIPAAPGACHEGHPDSIFGLAPITLASTAGFGHRYVSTTVV